MADALVTNTSDREQIQRARRIEKDRIRQRFDLVALQLSTREGRRFVWMELERHGIYDRVLSSGNDLGVIGQFLGRREVGLELLEEVMRQHPDDYLLMQGEAVLRAAHEAREHEAIALANEAERRQRGND